MIISKRSLGNYERISWMLDQTRNLHFAMAAEITGRATAEEWRHALNMVQQRHPLLHCAIDGNDVLAPAFYNVPDVEIPLRIIAPESFVLEAELEKELTAPFHSAQVPLARAALMLEGGRAIFILATHHTIADGISHAYIFRDLLTVLAGSDLNALPVPPSLEHQLGLRTDTFSENDSNSTSGQVIPDRKKSMDKPAVQCLKISAELSAAVAARAKHKGTTVHGALCAAVVLAARQLSGALSERPVRVLTPVNLRKALDVGEDCGYYINPRIVPFAEDLPRDFWETARFAKQNLLEVTDRELLTAEMTGLAAAFGSLDVEAAGALGDMAFQYEFILTNIGVIPFDPDFGTFKLQAVWGPLMLNAVAGENNIGVATVGGAIHLTHISREPLAGLLPLMEQLLTSAASDRTNA